MENKKKQSILFGCPCSVIIRQTESIFSYIRDWSFLQEQKTETFLSKQLPHIPLYWTVKKNCPRSFFFLFCQLWATKSGNYTEISAGSAEAKLGLRKE